MAHPAAAGRDSLVRYQLRTVAIGVWITALTIIAMAGYALLPGNQIVYPTVYWISLVIGAIASTVVALFPWKRWLRDPRGIWAFYLWSAGDIALISVAVAASGGASSDLWIIYVLTTLFFAASYPHRGQAARLVVTASSYAIAVTVAGGEISAAAMLLRASILGLTFLMAMFLAKELRAEMERRSDATLRAHLAEAQARRAEWFRALVQDSGDIVTSFDLEGRILYMSAAARELGYDPDEMIGTYVSGLVHPDDVAGVIAKITEQFESNLRPTPIEYRGRHADGSYRYLEGVATNLLSEPTVNAVVVNARDVTERKRAELLLASQSEVLARIAAGAPIDAVLRAATELVQEHAHALCTITVNGAPGSQLMVVSSDPRTRDEQDADDGDAGWSRDIIAGNGDVLGSVRLRFASPRFATPGDQSVSEVAANLAAIALERDAAEARLAHQARHDSLTGLANRQVFVNTLEHALTSARTHETIAVLFVDLDGFKEVNDNMGHYVGDQVLMALGHRLAAALRMHDVIARFGGDEFVALCRVEQPDQALGLADAILERVREPISLGSNCITLDASIGVTLASVFADEGPRWVVNAAWVQAAADELLRQADTAMYRAKEKGGGRTELYGTEPPPRPHLRAAGDPD
jgi:diguanylate cyclase (GGDEF)-like protein/PAS domain S-box-containing protein